MEPTPQKHREVVYRRTPDGGPGANPSRSFESWIRGIAPAITPLVIGFVLLLVIISGLGFLSVRLMNDISFGARDVRTQRWGRLALLWDLRTAVDKLDKEARARARTEAATRDLALPFDLG